MNNCWDHGGRPFFHPHRIATQAIKQNMRIRRYHESDHEEVWALHNVALRAISGAHARNGPWDDDLRNVRDVYLEMGGEFLVGTQEGTIVAMGALKRLSANRVEIKRMRVHPDFQRRGWGQAILEKLETRAAELGHGTLQLDTTVQQIAAQRLYVKNGYIETGRTKMGAFDVILYEKTLSTDD